jgi:outer membrane protein assembly factor BamB
VFETDESVSTPTVVSGTVFVGTEGGTLFAVDAATGSKQGKLEVSDEGIASPTVEDGTGFVRSRDETLHAVKTGVSASSE